MGRSELASVVPSQDDLAEWLRAALAGAGDVREVRMFGGLCFMLNGNMVAGVSKRGLLVRVGKDREAEALAQPGARPMAMAGRSMKGYVVIDPPPDGERAAQDWLARAVGFVTTLPSKDAAATRRKRAQ